MDPKPPVQHKPQLSWDDAVTPTAAPPVTINYPRRTLTVHQVTSSELDTVASLSNSIHLTMLGISAGTFVSFSTVLATVSISQPVTAAMFTALTWVSGLASLFFGARSYTSYREARQKLRDIKSGLI